MNSIITESQHRLFDTLYRSLGENIISWLQDPEINEVMLNPDGTLFIDRHGEGHIAMGRMSKTQSLSIINTLAGIHNMIITRQTPKLEAELPFYKAMRGERFTGLIPPIVSNPCFTLRKKSDKIFTLMDYVHSKRLTAYQKNILQDLIISRKNILVCGGPGSGKTTLTNALIHEAVLAEPSQRFVILEDTPELQCKAPNTVSLLTSEAISMRGLLKSAMRLSPDRILVGEVRGGEALDMLKAWNTGCPGGICTVHANGCDEAIQRILDLAMEAGIPTPPINLLLHTIDAVVFVSRSNHQKGCIDKIIKISGYENGSFITSSINEENPYNNIITIKEEQHGKFNLSTMV